MFVSIFFLFSLADLPYGIQLASLIPYTAFVLLGTFSARVGQPYFFECPIVHRNLPRLALRHGGYLTALVVLETVALNLRTSLPDSWLIASGKDGSPFTITLVLLCIGLAFIQIVSNRSLLERAHSENMLA